MINHFTLLRNLGQFDNVGSGATIDLTKLTLIYAENGRGKTTVASLLRSLGQNDPNPINERKRLGSQHDPHIVLDCDGNPANVVFQTGVWSRSIPEIAVFDDVFVTENVYSGLAVDSNHRQNLHELILGAQGVQLNAELQRLVAEVEAHNVSLRQKQAAVPEGWRGGYTIDQFCALNERPNIDAELKESELKLAAAEKAEQIQNASSFQEVAMPSMDLQTFESILSKELRDIDRNALDQVRQHLGEMDGGGENWVSQGMKYVQEHQGEETNCPFCAQDLEHSPILNHYRAYFSRAYSDLKSEVEVFENEFQVTHGGGAQVNLERAARQILERRDFWKEFFELPPFNLETETFVNQWQAARDLVLEVMSQKRANPLEPIVLAEAVRQAINQHNTNVEALSEESSRILEQNAKIELVKEQASSSSIPAIKDDIIKQHAVKKRHEADTDRLCREYLDERAAKARTEAQRDQARDALDQYRNNIFPQYEASINLFLQRFNAGYRLQRLTSQNTRGGSACSYSVLINNVEVPATGSNPTPGEPAFRNTLSAGDRNTLALAFFFASIDQDPNKINRIAVIDDPMTSLDEHRTLTTCQEIRRLADEINQVIVLSHSKSFLCEVWQGSLPNVRSALLIGRTAQGSDLQAWNVSADAETEYDRNHYVLRDFVANGSPDTRGVAEKIRPVLEGFMRVNCPQHFGSGSLLGPFINNTVRPKLGTADEIFNAADTQELQNLLDYGNRFHHDTNPNWRTANINDQELADFSRRTLTFVRKH